jgi:hypothetical protein
MLSGVLAEPVDAGDPRRRGSFGGGVRGELGIGERPDHEDLVAVEGDLRRSYEPVGWDPACEPAAELFVR